MNNDPPETIPSTGESEKVGEDEIYRVVEETLIHMNELMESVKNRVKIESLQKALDLLEAGFKKGTYEEESHPVINHYLTTVRLLRHGIYRWIEDLDWCFDHFDHLESVENAAELVSTTSDEGTTGIKAAVELIKECRESIDVGSLTTLINIGEDFIASQGDANSIPSYQYAILLIAQGYALVIRYLNCGAAIDLNQASIKFQTAERLCTNNGTEWYIPLAYISLTSLAHIEWLRCTDCGKSEGIAQLKEYMAEANALDKEARDYLEYGVYLVESAADDTQFEKATPYISVSLQLRLAPHPRRLISVQHMINAIWNCCERFGVVGDLDEWTKLCREALFTCASPHPSRWTSLSQLALNLSISFQHQGDIKDLEECIELYREAGNLRPTPPGEHSSSLSNLAIELFTRFEHGGNFDDLEESIQLHRQALDLRPASHPERSKSLNNLANGLSTRFDHQGDFEDLDQSIVLHREALYLRPASHPYRSSSLNNLANTLCTRFENKGSFDDLEESIALHQEALDLRPVPHADRSKSLNNLAVAFSTRFQHKGSSDDLEMCIILSQEILDLCPALHPDRAVALNNLAANLSIRFERNGNFDDLEKSIRLHREVLDLHPIPHPDRPLSLFNLATALSNRFEQSGNHDDLEESILLNQEALDLHPAGHPSRPRSMDNLAGVLYTRFQHTGDFNDLEKCIMLCREALDLWPAPHPSRSTILSNLAVHLFTRFLHKGGIDDLEESVMRQKEALDLQLVSHPERSRTLNNLANALSYRFQHRGGFEDLDKCILHHREALDQRPSSHPGRFKTLNNLAANLLARFVHKGSFDDLEESIVLHREALDLSPMPHPNHAHSLNNLANALSARFNYREHIDDLEECIALHQKALELWPVPHPDRSMALNNLANALSTRFHYMKRIDDLGQCIALHKEALALLPAPHPSRSQSLNNLANALSTRFEHKGFEAQFVHSSEYLPTPLPVTNSASALQLLCDHSTTDSTDLVDALRYFEEASQYETGYLLDRLRSSKDWANFAQKHSPSSTLHAYQCAIGLLPQLASLDVTLQQRQDVVQHSQDLVSNAAKCAIDADQCDMAVMFLSTGRSVFWSQALQLRAPVDQLAAAYPTLAEEFTTISSQLEYASFSGHISSSQLLDEQTTMATYTSLHALAEQRQQIIQKIRAMPGFDQFLQPPSFQSLQSAADGGPVIFLNASALGCDILIMDKTRSVQHIPLTDISWKELDELKNLAQISLQIGGRSTDVSQEISDILDRETFLTRDMERNCEIDTNEDIFRLILGCLWTKVAQPVIKALGFTKANTPGRIWWCPTGPFTSLPIHAAGVYSDTSAPIDCLFEYAISSYCTSPQDLLHPQPKIAHDFRMTAIIEPEAPGAPILPATQEELQRIEQHIPGTQHLLTHIGSNGAQTDLDTLLADVQSSSFAHFGCHGTQNLNNPLESYLLLSGGKLTMSRIIKECKVPEGALAYLSACETAKGDEVRPDESLNLVATMMFAGFRSVVGTMWSIMDEDAPIVAEIFYSHLFRKGKTAPPDVKDAAHGLHLATKELRDLRRPFFNWVPYVHYGI